MPRQNCMRVFAMFDVFSDVVLRVHRRVGGEKEDVAATGRDDCKSDGVGEGVVVAETIKVGSTESEKNAEVTLWFCTRYTQVPSQTTILYLRVTAVNL
jgi:hypothetical protein